ncbi:MAG: hypothetical protein WCI00_02095 [bacterium]
MKFKVRGIRNTLSRSFHEEKSDQVNICLIIIVSIHSIFVFISSYSLSVLSSLSVSCVEVLIHNFATVPSRMSCTSWIFIATFGQTMAVILFTPEATASCPMIAKQPISLVLAT